MMACSDKSREVGLSKSTEPIFSAKDVSRYEPPRYLRNRAASIPAISSVVEVVILQIGNHPATAQRERNHTRCIGEKLLAITNPFGASAQG